ncbi:hypothetical protein PU634_08740 [Oceanimonas pelagia]|uniref:Uncharacterized protein n=1 Tax=Oceanimonas pelagia TaxID=3028314 RepID=A0AA50QAI5_9GAMM|nr:hypothetical protein [Oceanimonas pelagia]WMC09217.1 hypothetical protein PU634_08740 [Oceanimonas pelagia]
MKALCITGMNSANLEQIGSFVIQGDIAEAKPVKRGTSVTIQDWESTILAKQSSPSALKVSSLWRQLASDLLLNNIDSSIWAWVSNNTSTVLLDFWAELDHDIHFLLICNSLQDCLLEEVNKGAQRQELATCYENWCNYHQALLAFYLKHPERCLLVDASNALLHPAELLNVMGERWQWQLGDTVLPDLCEHNDSQDAIAGYIVHQLQQEYFPQPDFAAELNAAQHPLLIKSGKTSSDKTIAIEDVISGYQYQREQQQKLIEENKALYQQNLSMLENSKEQQELLAKHIDELQTEIVQLNGRNNAQQQATEQANARLAHVENEAEALLLELHNTQVELEQALTDYASVQQQRTEAEQQVSRFKQHSQQQAQQQQTLQNQMSELEAHRNQLARSEAELHDRVRHVESEAEKLLVALHNTQQELEQALSLNASAEQQIARLEQRNQQQAQQQQALQDKVSQLEIHCHQLARSETQLHDRVSHVESEAEKLLVELYNTQQELEQALGRQIELEKQLQPQPQVEQLTPRTGLPKLWNGKKTTLPKLGFSELELRHVQVNPDYEHLWFSLKNPQFGKRQLPHWQFRLSCAAIRPGQFGSQPKLEFPKQSQQLLGNWFAESQDDFGEKLELRFALPDAMDKGLWKKLGKEDQRLIQALILQLPAILQQAQQRRPALTRKWQDWHNLAQDINRIYTLKTQKGK